MSVIVGRKLRGPLGAMAALLGMILPGGAIVMILGFAYVRFRQNPNVALVLAGVAAAAVGLLLHVTLKIGWKNLIRPKDLVFVTLVFVLVGIFHMSLLVTIVSLAPLAIWLNRPVATDGEVMSKIVELINLFALLSMLAVGEVRRCCRR